MFLSGESPILWIALLSLWWVLLGFQSCRSLINMTSGLPTAIRNEWSGPEPEPPCMGCKPVGCKHLGSKPACCAWRNGFEHGCPDAGLCSPGASCGHPGGPGRPQGCCGYGRRWRPSPVFQPASWCRAVLRRQLLWWSWLWWLWCSSCVVCGRRLPRTFTPSGRRASPHLTRKGDSSSQSLLRGTGWMLGQGRFAIKCTLPEIEFQTRKR